MVKCKGGTELETVYQGISAAHGSLCHSVIHHLYLQGLMRDGSVMVERVDKHFSATSHPEGIVIN